MTGSVHSARDESIDVARAIAMLGMFAIAASGESTTTPTPLETFASAAAGIAVSIDRCSATRKRQPSSV